MKESTNESAAYVLIYSFLSEKSIADGSSSVSGAVQLEENIGGWWWIGEGLM